MRLVSGGPTGPLRRVHLLGLGLLRSSASPAAAAPAALSAATEATRSHTRRPFWPSSCRVSLWQRQFLQQQQLQQQQQQQHEPVPLAAAALHSAAASVIPSHSKGSQGAPLVGPPSGAPWQCDSPSLDLPPYIQRLSLGRWNIYFYPVPQYLKSIDRAPINDGAPSTEEGPNAWEAALLVAALQPQLLCVECCSSRLKQLVAAAAEAAAAAADGGSLEEETRKQQRRLARGFSLLTSFDGGLLHAALLPIIVAASSLPGRSWDSFLGSPFGGPPSSGGPPSGAPTLPAVYPIDRDRTSTARRLHECLLLQATQMRALRACVLQALTLRWAWGPLRPAVVGSPGGPPGGPRGGLRGPYIPTEGPLPSLGAPPSWGALQWAQRQREVFPSGYQVLLEERASCAAANIWNAIQDTEEKMQDRGPLEGPWAEGGPIGGAPKQGEAGIKLQCPERPCVGLVFCSTALLPLVVESLQQLHALEAPKAAAVAAAAAAGTAAAAAGGAGEQRPHYRTTLFAALNRSPPCLMPLLLLRFLLLPAAAAYGLAAAVKALSSWLYSSIHRGDPPAAIGGELQVPISEAPTRGPFRGAPQWGPLATPEGSLSRGRGAPS
ncbi:hypothetical protein, conserved [Eimeria praecox]|uniref:Uncharacterized protein n=1 Tax=Eimeria praecox TaxID=51316 RepID=U6G585_9EIME|nr:hypothetical protein, conserved [Eimeria praecox]